MWGREKSASLGGLRSGFSSATILVPCAYIYMHKPAHLASKLKGLIVIIGGAGWVFSLGHFQL